MKICCECKKEKDLSEFSKNKNSKDGLQYTCKNCCKQYRNLNKEKISSKRKKYYKKNKDKILNKNKQYHKQNKEKRLEYYKEYRKQNKEKLVECIKDYNNNKVNFNTYASQICFADPVKNVDGYLQTKCAYCGKWYFPQALSVRNRITSLNGKTRGENRLYCSNGCKRECPIFNQKIWPKGFKEATSREVQPQLRQIVLKRDDYKCIKCNNTENLHCHHIEGIRWEPIESADVDKCITVCKNCHIKIHKIPGCGYHDMNCNK